MLESVLDNHKLYYEDIAPRKMNTRKGGKINKMTKNTKTVTEAPAKSYNKTRGEHLKDIIIAVLVVGVMAFIAGVHYSSSQNAAMQSAVKSAQATALVPATETKK